MVRVRVRSQLTSVYASSSASCAERCQPLRRWSLLATVTLQALSVIPGIFAAEPPRSVPEIACDDDIRAGWQRLRDRLRGRLPSFSGRVPFSIFHADLELLEEIRTELAVLGYGDAVFSGAFVDVPLVWSECAFGMLAVQLIAILTQLSVPKAKSSGMAMELLPIVLAAPWVDVLRSGWPIFRSLAVLARWASPHGVDGSYMRPGGSTAIGAAESVPVARCDAAEVGAVPVARRELGRAWRNRDPRQEHVDAPRDTLIEGVLADIVAGPGPGGAVWGGKAGGCRWTEHGNRYLGGLVDSPRDDEDDNLIGAMAACDREADCAGVTTEPAPERANGVRFTLRRGEPLLEASPVGEISYTRWCGADFSQDDAYAAQTGSSEPSAHASPESPSRPLCPFAHAVGLLAVSVRRLGGGSLSDFAPELVIQAASSVAAWATHFGPYFSGRDAWATEWPLWELLGRLEQRLELHTSPAMGGDSRLSVPRWTKSLQQALGFDDDAWRLATSELEALSGGSADAARNGVGAIPQALREEARCADGEQCVGEFFARLHLLLYGAGKLPLRDQINMNADDALSRIYMERGQGVEDDWQRIVPSGHHEPAGETRQQRLDRLMPTQHPLQVDRRQLASFVLEAQEIIADRPLGRCLEWDQPFLLVRAFKGVCRWTDVFSYSEPDPDEPLMGLPGRHEYTYGTRHYWGDLGHADGLGIEPDTFDLVLVPFVFEHVPLPFVAMRNLAYVVRSGGYILWAAPFFQHYHGSPHDYFRYTPNGARALAEDAGLEVVRLYAPGDLSLVSGVMMGLLLPYWSEDRALAEAPPVPGEDSPRHPLNVFMLLRKPPRGVVSSTTGAGSGGDSVGM